MFVSVGIPGVMGSGVGEAAGIAPARGVIEYVEGEVFLDSAAAQVGDVIENGSTIRTGDDGVCEIVIGAKNIIRVLEGTQAVIDLDPQNPTVNLQSGAAAAVLNTLQVLGRRRTLNFTTSSTVAGVRGTALFIRVEEGGSTYVCTCYGTLRLNAGSATDALDVSSSHHAAYRFTRNDHGGMSVVRAGLLYHDDKAMEALADRIGVRIPWEDTQYTTPEDWGGSSSGY